MPTGIPVLLYTANTPDTYLLNTGSTDRIHPSSPILAAWVHTFRPSLSAPS
jgi:hypothetical protein